MADARQEHPVPTIPQDPSSYTKSPEPRGVTFQEPSLRAASPRRHTRSEQAPFRQHRPASPLMAPRWSLSTTWTKIDYWARRMWVTRRLKFWIVAMLFFGILGAIVVFGVYALLKCKKSSDKGVFSSWRVCN
ncbi:hypothetical protein BU24DRAFT_259518 [Aaosphaeria arxii CBS 175.79]|uniref:Uncharacterized protein n=1 Tax=Aaosphaeria arxii CBS 175.79 TaxID=1450172 RepID=A0A6A5XJ22_9PLEO|nr:uncharacterized protein BU24DRAFT_259518 [Aaosphaeria arxii CBS 175.79]KAF2012831.1 hypothetical protein BU24DRAFT_259518 [Aaosphaeria arxii CBS 175.79]